MDELLKDLRIGTFEDIIKDKKRIAVLCVGFLFRIGKNISDKVDFYLAVVKNNIENDNITADTV